ncbi:DUF4175 family protein [Aestuariibaculum lutulentum]|uniref:DUF4175 family protein n=1 Tax=Aestuariibaculum lutulentum TaxID=2920935 RepID=A0ABS9RGV2_9FLAO|nr:DUF4175 family protein [Aestuariibaculum lutulentum]MCH4552142.1 hypothetical protein [Aestuariibaculum lutulentum]
MTNFNNIQLKLEGFIKRYYYNELLKGAILFFAIGLLYFLGTLLVEYMLWLNTTARTILFWLFVFVEIGLLIKFIVWPLSKLVKLQKGINYEQASRIIGEHFPEVNDKLLNVLQLNKNSYKSDLLLASIEQKSVELSPIPFKLAINFKANIKYLKYAAIPVLILLAVFFTGNFNWFSDSYKRVVHYKTAYEPPAPFQFFVINDDLNALEDKDFKLLVRTSGSLTPENVQITYNDETYYLQQTGVGEFEYIFTKPKEQISFQLQANNVESKPYLLKLIEVPSLLDFQMVLDYPVYTNKEDEILRSTGNAVVPEGTKVSWKLKTKSTSQVHLYSKDTILFAENTDGEFETSKQVFNDFNYSLSTSNTQLSNYENLGFNIDVIKDAYPELNVKMQTDSLDLQTLYFYGQVSDDYGFSKLQMVYYPADDASNLKTLEMNVSNSNYDEFITSFPYNVDIQDGVAYELFFQVYDNDVVNHYKTVKSNTFSYRKRTVEEEKQKNLQEQKETIKDLNKSLKNFEEQEKQLEQLSNTQKEKETLNFNDKKKLESFLERQKQQDELMKNFNKKFKDNIENFPQDKKDDPFNEDLKKRLDENEEKLKQDEELLEELEKFKDKITKEQLANRLEELAKQNKNKKRSLEQLLELTKRFYVQQKLDKLKDDLMQMAIKQDDLSKQEREENTKENQDALNKEFQKFTEELENLQKESKGLKKPIDVPQDKLEENEIKKEQKNASKSLDQDQELQNSDQQSKDSKQNENMQNAQKSQKRAAEKMKKMSDQMQSSMQAGGGEQMQEDVDMLRQILDNLVLFSFDEEALMNQFKGIEEGHSKYAGYLKNQNNLREHFEHIDDSLFALSLRQPKLSEQVNKEITEVYYNVDKALNYFAEGQVYQGISNQQFTVTAANNLANFLSSVLDNMEEQLNMSQSSSGQGDMQLPDIIMSQEQLNEMMQEGMKQSEEGQPKDEEGQGEEKKSQGDNEGKDGKSGEEGEMNENGEGDSEELNGLLYEIYQRQQELRNALEERISKEGSNANSDRLIRSMEQIEMELLNKGFTNQTLQKMMNLKHQLLKLDNATFQQGEDNKRESETNNNTFNNTSNNQLPNAKQYFNTTEILNKQTLPLQPDYKKKVQVYFKQSND